MNNIINISLFSSLLLLVFLAFSNPNKANIIANKWFCLFLICILFITLEDSLISSGINYENEFLSLIPNLSSFLIAPFFYLSVCYFINPIRKWQNKDLKHFLFAILFCVLLGNFSFLNIENYYKNEFFKTLVSLFPYVFIGLFAIQLIFYGFLSFKKIRSHQKKIEIFSSNTEQINLKWLEKIVFGVFILSILWSIDIVFEISKKTDFPILNFILLVSVYYIAYHSTNQKEIFLFNENQKNDIIEILDIQNHKNNNSENQDVISENKKKIISDEKLETIKTELLDLMNNEKLFLDSELNLVKLSIITNVSLHQLSYVINTSFNENFFLFINRFRVEEAKKLITNPKMNHLSILGIGFEVGFNSKTAFNTTFKKITGETPSEFKNKYK